jgi:hypothetical protein
MNERRWDTDERGEGIASGAAFSPNLQELADGMRDAGWVAEEPGVHLLPHLEAACAVPGSPWTIVSWSLGDDGVVEIETVWGGEWGAWGVIRAEVFSLLGSIAEPTSHIRQRMFEERMFEERVDFEMATGTLAEGSPFTPHGHLIRLRVRPA